LVVIDSTTGQEIYRTADLGAARDLGPFIPAWDARGRLLVGRMSEGGPIRERIDLATGIAEEVGRGLPVGALLSSPDGRNLVIGAGDRSQIDLHVVDPDLGRSRPLARLDGTPAAWATWAPDGTALAILTFFESTNSAFAHNEILIVDVATGSVDRHPIDAVGGQLMWLPEDQAGAP
jgi:hypothetical protein